MRIISAAELHRMTPEQVADWEMEGLDLSEDFRALVRKELGLLSLYRDACRIRAAYDRKRHRYVCANEIWYGYGIHSGLKPRLLMLVGWNARKPELRDSRAYDIAYDEIYRVLPHCRNCLCV